MDPRAPILVVAGSAQLLLGLWIRRGGLRQRVLMYRDFSRPWFYRNSAFVHLPSGLFLLSVGLGYSLMQIGGPIAALVSAALLPVAIAAAILSVAWLLDPPQVAKPPWLLDEERLTGKPIDPHPRIRKFERISVVLLAGVAVALLLAGVVIGLGEMLLGIAR